MSEERPVGAYVAVNRSRGLLGWLIASATAPGHPLWPFGRRLDRVPSHARIGVRWGNGRRAFFEALEGCDVPWRGPQPEAWARAWVNGKRGRWTWILELDGLVGQEGAQEILRRCERRRSLWTYSVRQLWWMWLGRRLGRKVPRSPGDVVCSEAVVRILNGEPELGEHPLLPRGWNSKPADAMSPLDVFEDLLRLKQTMLGRKGEFVRVVEGVGEGEGSGGVNSGQ